MANLSTYLADRLRDHLWRGITYTPPDTLYFALFHTVPTSSGGGAELAGNGYTRVAMARSGSVWSAPGTGATENATAITWPPATADWLDIKAVVVLDAASGGNLLAIGAVPLTGGVGVVILANERAQIDPGLFDFVFPVFS